MSTGRCNQRVSPYEREVCKKDLVENLVSYDDRHDPTDLFVVRRQISFRCDLCEPLRTHSRSSRASTRVTRVSRTSICITISTRATPDARDRDGVTLHRDRRSFEKLNKARVRSIAMHALPRERTRSFGNETNAAITIFAVLAAKDDYSRRSGTSLVAMRSS